jgi:peptidoglycan-N-acetylglucosamine deacetylase
MTTLPARVTLSFDNGPTSGVTDKVLDLLAERDVRATFFVIGNKLRHGPARSLAARAVAEGHQVGNHTLSHRVPLGQLERDGEIEEVIRQIDEAQALLGDLAPRKLFRPYGAGGVLDDRLIGPQGLAHLVANDFEPVTWNCVPRDWVDPLRWVETCEAMMDGQDWSVIVIHDIANAALDGLPRLLDRLADANVELRDDFPDDCRLTLIA